MERPQGQRKASSSTDNRLNILGLSRTQSRRLNKNSFPSPLYFLFYNFYFLSIYPITNVFICFDILKNHKILCHTILRVNSLTWDGKKVEVLKGSIIY